MDMYLRPDQRICFEGYGIVKISDSACGAFGYKEELFADPGVSKAEIEEASKFYDAEYEKVKR
jgi:hypothetical protein